MRLNSIRTLTLLTAIAFLPSAGYPLKVELKEIVGGFEQPLYVTHAGDGSGRIFVVEHTGIVKIVKGGQVLPTPFIDISESGLDVVSRLRDESDERGLLGMAFHPDFKTNRKFYLSYTRKKDGASMVSEFTASESNPDIANKKERVILGPIDQPQWNHNGGMIEFGPDGLLYISIGDGGFRADEGPGHTPEIGNAQDTTNMLGTILRIDVDKPSGDKNYSIPADNPFAKNPGDNQAEIYAWGLRNVWRFSFDRKTGRLFAADVGQDLWEEIDIIVAGNYGWRFMEGTYCFNPAEDCQTGDLILPIYEYPHKPEEGGGLSITGGYVYRGKAYPAMEGLYFYADYASGRFWSLEETAENKWEATEHFRVGFYIPTFGEDEDGEIYITNKSRGTLLQVIDAGAGK